MDWFLKVELQRYLSIFNAYRDSNVFWIYNKYFLVFVLSWLKIVKRSKWINYFLRKLINLNSSTVYQSKTISFDQHKIESFTSSPCYYLAAWVSLYVFCPVFIPWNTKKLRITSPLPTTLIRRGSSHWILASQLFIWGLWLLSTLWVNGRCRDHQQATKVYEIPIISPPL